MLPERSDVLIVGSGPAGLAAALELRRLGVARVTVVDREPEPGGTPRLCHHTGFGIRDLKRVYDGPGYARHYVQQARARGISIHTCTTITGWAGPTALTFTSPDGIGVISAQAVILATGCRERPRSGRLVPGSRPQGILTTGSLQRLLYEYRLSVGYQAVVVGAELVSLSALFTLQQAGVAVAAMVTQSPDHQIYFPYAPIRWAMMNLVSRVSLLSSAAVSQIHGCDRVEAVSVRNLETGQVEQIACDTVVFTGEWIPEQELAHRHNLAIDGSTLGPQVDRGFRTTVPGVFAAGNLLHGAETADVSALEGRTVARSVLCYLADPIWPVEGVPILTGSGIRWIAPNRVSQPAEQVRGKSFLIRVDGVHSGVNLRIRQDDHVLFEKRFDRLQPNRTYRIGDSWVRGISGGTEAAIVELVLE